MGAKDEPKGAAGKKAKARKKLGLHKETLKDLVPPGKHGKGVKGGAGTWECKPSLPVR